MTKVALALCGACLIALPLSTPSFAALVEFSGHSWETGGFPDSSPGDELSFMSVVDLLASPLTWTPTDHQYTLAITSLISEGQAPVDPFNIQVTYGAGGIHVFEDTISGGTLADPGINPPNATAPATYTDGTDYLIGTLNSFTITYNTTFETGAFEGEVLVLGGSHSAELGVDSKFFTFGGVFKLGTPEGYDLTWNGFILLDGVPVESRTWGNIKAQFSDFAGSE